MIQRGRRDIAHPGDVDEAYRVGQTAVREAVAGKTGFMVSIIREPGPQYRSTLGLVPLERVANAVRQVPDEFIAPAGDNGTTAGPLAGPPLPEYARLARVPVPARLA